MKVIQIMNFGNDDEVRYYPIGDEELVTLNCDEDGDYVVDDDGYCQGFRVKDKLITEENCEVFNEVEFKIISSEIDFFGIGYDKIIALVDGEEEVLVSSRWEGSTDYYFKSELFFNQCD